MNNNENFAMLLEESSSDFSFKTNVIIKATVIASDRHYVTVDAGLPMEADIPTNEFLDRPEVGDEVSVIVFAFDNGDGQAAISHHSALQIESSELVEAAIADKSIVTAKAVKATRAGLLVKVGALDGFLPNSLIDTVRIEKETLLGKKIDVVPLSIDDKNRNVVVSRKEALITQRGGRIEPLVGELAVGDVREGIIKNILRFGAFVDLGGKDCLIHISDMGWDVTSIDPIRDFEIGQRVKGLINKTDGNGKFFMSLRQSNMEPWIAAKEAINVGDKVTAKIVKIEEDYSLIAIVNGVPAIVPKSEVSWVHKKGYELYQTFPAGKEFEAVVTGFCEDEGTEHVQLSVKQTQHNPWTEAGSTIAEGNTLSVEVKSTSDTHVIVSLTDDISAIVPFREIAWGDCQQAIRDLHTGDEIDVKILSVEPNEHRVVASIRETTENPFAGVRKGRKVECKITGFNRKGNAVFVEFSQNDKIIKGFVSARHALPAKSASMNADEYYSIGDKVQGEILAIDGDRIQVNLRNGEQRNLESALGSKKNNAMFDAMNAAKQA
ncbi:conserved hypothetical protein [Vibrio chagasii]|nr:conserved hypothetical protein [Vibrio chagasii]